MSGERSPAPRHPSELRIVTRRAPTPALLRPAIEARLADRPWPDGPEAAVADAVARAVRDAAGSAGRGRRP